MEWKKKFSCVLKWNFTWVDSLSYITYFHTCSLSTKASPHSYNRNSFQNREERENELSKKGPHWTWQMCFIRLQLQLLCTLPKQRCWEFWGIRFHWQRIFRSTSDVCHRMCKEESVITCSVHLPSLCLSYFVGLIL